MDDAHPILLDRYRRGVASAIRRLRRGEAVAVPRLGATGAGGAAASPDGAVLVPPASRRTGAVVLAAPDPLARAAALLLAAGTGRRLVPLAGRDWARRALPRALDALSADSVCLVAAPWSDAPGAGVRGPLTGDDLADAFAAFRDWCGRRRRRAAAGEAQPPAPAWGVLAAVDPFGLSRAVEKALGAPGAAAAPAGASVGVVLPDGPPTGLEPPDPVPGAGVAVLRMSRLHKDRPIPVLTRPWDWLVVVGHGRSYCVNEGLLCGTRTIDEAPDAPVRDCMGRWDCVTPHHLAVDIRRVAARILVVDSCEAANPLAPAVSDGHPPLALLALQGAPSAVIAADGITMRGDADDHRDILRAAAGTGTVGAAAAAVNALRAGRNAPFAYVVFGDPETPNGPVVGEALRTPSLAPSPSPAPSPAPRPAAPPSLGRALALAESVEGLAGLGGGGDELRMGAAGAAMQALERDRGKGWWPHQLWPTAEVAFDGAGGPCPVCGGIHTVARRYRTEGGATRRWTECLRCRITADDPPGADDLEMAVYAPDRLARGAAEAHVSLRLREGAGPLVGAVGVGIDGTGHGVEVDRAVFPVRLAAGGRCTLAFTLRRSGEAPVAQLYFLRGIALLSGRCHWRSRPISVERSPGREARP